MTASLERPGPSLTREAPRGPGIVGVSRALREAVACIDEFADSDLPVLLLGASGVGKELLASRVHHRSRRPGGLVAVNCAALPPELAEAELFGALRGSYTGAVQDREGLVHEADRGTLFLDEVCSLPVGVQGKLLRFLESGEVRRLGERRIRRLDVRTVAAAQRLDVIASGPVQLRDDLVHRLAGVVIAVPSLAERVEDVEPLARHFAMLEGCELSADAVVALAAWPWPGNVRELKHAVRRAARLAPAGLITPGLVRSALALGPSLGLLGAPGAPSHGAGSMLSERAQFLEIVHEIGTDARMLAARMGISRATLFRRLGEWGLSLRDVRRSRQLRP